jgi:hypothetical protein
MEAAISTHLPSQRHQEYEELTAMNEEVDSDDEDED